MIKDFSEETFLIGAKKAFKIIVSSYKENNIESADQFLAQSYLKAFREQIKTIILYNFKITN